MHLLYTPPARSAPHARLLALAAASSTLLLDSFVAAVRFVNEGDGTAPCHRYRGTINGGPLLGSSESNSSIDCEEACRATSGCYAFVYTPMGIEGHTASLSSAGHLPIQGQASCTVYNQSNIGDEN
eukprot:COSAG02_NODE_26692_length_627_cov_0.742424_1_plen_125_part_10